MAAVHSVCAWATTRAPITVSDQRARASVQGCAAGTGARGPSPAAMPRSRAARRAAAHARGCWKDAPVLTSITDEHFRGWTRLPTFGRTQRGGLWTAAFALAVRRAGVRVGRKVRTAQQARALDSFAGRRRAGRQHGARVQEHAVRMESRNRPRRVGHIRAHAGHGDARRRPSGLVASQLCGASSTTRHSISSYSPRKPRPPSSTPTPSLTGRAPAGSALESRPVGIARVLPDSGGSRLPSRRSCASGGFPAMC